MTPFDLEETVRKAQEAVQKDQSQVQHAIFHMLTVLLRHEADKEAAHLRDHGPR